MHSLSPILGSSQGTQSLFTCLEEILTYHDINSSFYFAIGQKKHHSKTSPYMQRLYLLKDLIDVVRNLDPRLNCWASQNTFLWESRTIAALATINLAWTDIDYYKVPELAGKTGMEILEMLLEICTRYDYPLPSQVNDSGQGLQVKWRFTKPLEASRLFEWNTLMLGITEQFNSLGADPASKDAARILRLVDTVNTKNGAVCKTIFRTDIAYDFDELCKKFPFYPVHEEEEAKARRERRGKTTPKARTKIERAYGENLVTYSERRLGWHRFCDLRTLAKIRNQTEGVKEGHRDIFLFLTAVFLSWSSLCPNRLDYEVMDLFYHEFCPTVSESEAEGWLSSVVRRAIDASKGIRYIDPLTGKPCDPRYRYSNEELVRLLDITDGEQAHLKTIITKDEKKRRRQLKHGWDDRCLKNHQQVAKILKLAKEDITAKEIAQKMGLKPRWIQQLLSNHAGICNDG